MKFPLFPTIFFSIFLALTALFLQKTIVFGQGEVNVEIGPIQPHDALRPSPKVEEQNELKKTAAYTYEGPNYKIRIGYPDMDPEGFMALSLNTQEVDFGELSPTNPVERFVLLSLKSSITYGYSLIASASRPLAQATGTVIPDTTCDDGTCTEEKESTWTNILTYGFGYRCEEDCLAGSVATDAYRQFSDESLGERPQPLIRGIGKTNSEAKLIYKVNIQGNQPIDFPYNNTITYIALPDY
jgi:hypothetical protein